MLGPDKFTLESPNVIDPGDAPPSQPNRPVPSVEECRESAERLLNGDDDDDEYDERSKGTTPTYYVSDDNTSQDQLPSVEEARLYAATVLHTTDRRNHLHEPLTFDRTVTLDSPMRRQKRRKLCMNILGVAFIMTCIGLIVWAFTHHRGGPSKSDRMKEAIAFLSNGVSAFEDLRKTGTPQYRAALWLADEDPLQYNVPENRDDPDAHRFIQRYLLSLIYQSLDGPNWNSQLGFQSAEDECAWYETHEENYHGRVYAEGVTCDPKTFHVQSLYIPGNNLRGKLPTEIPHLSRLGALSLPNNDISGSIPTTFRHFLHLHELDLNDNAVTGELPQDINGMEKLQILSLSNNNLVGALPAALGQLAHLEILGLDDNVLTGDVSVIQNLVQLKYLYLDGNGFTGDLDTGFLDLPVLEEVDLSDNEISSTTVPAYLFNKPSLRVLDLSTNNLQGPFPPFPVNNVLGYLSLYSNTISGALPASLPNLRRLSHLDLEENNLSGPFPDVSAMTHVTYLFLGENFFDAGPFPAVLENLVNLRELSLVDLNMTGPIPPFVGDGLTQLRMLDLRMNRFNGPVPENIWDLPNMAFLLLNNNDLSGFIPHLFTVPDGLQIVSTYETNIRGDAASLCSSLSHAELLLTDCGVMCSCCTRCCADNKTGCFGDIVWEELFRRQGSWESNFTKTVEDLNPAFVVPGGSASGYSQRHRNLRWAD